MRTRSVAKTITRDPTWLGPAIHPGEMLLEEFLTPLGLGQVEAARRLGMSLNRLNELVLGKRGVTADTALRLARLFKTSPQFWMHLQADWDLQVALRGPTGRRRSRATA
ncbi:MAG: HigA family addiction module antitoxin [Acidobacteriota bacterium]